MTMFDDFKVFRQGLSAQSSVDQIAWAYLGALYQKQKEIGVWYLFDKDWLVIAKATRVSNRLAQLKLADKVGTEGGNQNMYMLINERGNYVIENFSSLAEYETYMAEEERKRQPNNSINVGGNMIGSQVGHGSVFGDLRNSQSNKPNNAQPTQAPQKKSGQDVWDKLKSIAAIAGFGAALIALITKLMDLW